MHSAYAKHNKYYTFVHAVWCPTVKLKYLVYIVRFSRGDNSILSKRLKKKKKRIKKQMNKIML